MPGDVVEDLLLDFDGEGEDAHVFMKLGAFDLFREIYLASRYLNLCIRDFAKHDRELRDFGARRRDIVRSNVTVCLKSRLA